MITTDELKRSPRVPHSRRSQHFLAEIQPDPVRFHSTASCPGEASLAFDAGPQLTGTTPAMESRPAQHQRGRAPPPIGGGLRRDRHGQGDRGARPPRAAARAGPFVAVNCGALTEASSRASSSATCAAPSPAPWRTRRGSSAPRTAARSSWTRRETSAWGCRRSFFGSSSPAGPAGGKLPGRRVDVRVIAASNRDFPRTGPAGDLPSRPLRPAGPVGNPASAPERPSPRTSRRSRGHSWRRLARLDGH